MITNRTDTLGSIVQSSGGVHFSAYIANRGQLKDLKHQISEAVETGKEKLLAVMSPTELDRFFFPILKLREDEKKLRTIPHNIAIFRTPDFFRLLSIPVKLDQLCVVATSFHVKPLLRWMQHSDRFILADFRDGICKIYLGSNETVNIVQVSKLLRDSSRITKGAFDVVNGILDLSEDPIHAKPTEVFLSGDPTDCRTIHHILRKTKVRNQIMSSNISDSIDEIISSIRRFIRLRNNAKIAESIRAIHAANSLNNVSKSLGQITRLASQGQIKKLMIAEDFEIFGKIHPLTGQLSVTPIQCDHEDDDILDDLAQQVLANGGEVLVTKQKWIPENQPAVAIVDTAPAPSFRKAKLKPDLLAKTG